MFEQVMKLNRTERLLFLVAAIIFFVSIAVIYKYKSFLFRADINKENAIAVIASADGNTRKRNPDSFKFEELESGNFLANGDYLYSGVGSQILLKFISGPRLLIGEQSLVVIREVDGTPDLKLQEGAFSGTFEEGREIEVMTEQESVIINGDHGAQFSVSYSSLGGLTIGSYKSPIKIQFEGKTSTLQNQVARVKKDSAIQVADRQTDDGDGKTPEKKQADASSDEGARVPAGMAIETSEMKEKVTLNPPYPKENHVFLHRKGGSIPVFPKLECAGSCELRLLIDGKTAATKLFERGKAPIIYVNVEPNIEGDVRWEFTDGGESKTGSFLIRQNSEVNFEKAFTQKNPIEVMD